MSGDYHLLHQMRTSEHEHVKWLRDFGALYGARLSADRCGRLYAIADFIEALIREEESVAALARKLILDTGHGCSICRGTPVVNIPGGSGTYWLCGGCVAERLEGLETERSVSRALARSLHDAEDSCRREAEPTPAPLLDGLSAQAEPSNPSAGVDGADRESPQRCEHENTAAASAIKTASVWCPDCKKWVVLPP